MDGSGGNHDAILVGVQPVARSHPHALNLYRKINLTFAAFGRSHRHQRQRSDTDPRLIQLGDVAHRAIDHDARPTVARSSCGEIATNQRATHGPCAFHNKHPADPSGRRVDVAG